MAERVGGRRVRQEDIESLKNPKKNKITEGGIN
jgi:hypothetical protein